MTPRCPLRYEGHLQRQQLAQGQFQLRLLVKEEREPQEKHGCTPNSRGPLLPRSQRLHELLQRVLERHERLQTRPGSKQLGSWSWGSSDGVGHDWKPPEAAFAELFLSLRSG